MQLYFTDDIVLVLLYTIKDNGTKLYFSLGLFAWKGAHCVTLAIKVL